MLDGRNDKWLLGEVRKAINELTIAERVLLIELFGLCERLELAGSDESSALLPESSRRWVELRALRKLRRNSLQFRSGTVSPIRQAPRDADRPVVVPLRRRDGISDSWFPGLDGVPEPEKPDNTLWDEV